MTAYIVFLEPPASPSLSEISSTSARPSCCVKDDASREERRQFTLNWLKNLPGATGLPDRAAPWPGMTGDLTMPRVPSLPDRTTPWPGMLE